jgi:hypothetical protein
MSLRAYTILVHWELSRSIVRPPGGGTGGRLSKEHCMGEAGQGGSVRTEVDFLDLLLRAGHWTVVGVDTLTFDTTTLLSMREGKRGPEAWAVGGEKRMDNETWGRRECEPSRYSQGYLPIVQQEEQKRQSSRRASSSLSFRAIVKTV